MEFSVDWILNDDDLVRVHLFDNPFTDRNDPNSKDNCGDIGDTKGFPESTPPYSACQFSSSIISSSLSSNSVIYLPPFFILVFAGFGVEYNAGWAECRFGSTAPEIFLLTTVRASLKLFLCCSLLRKGRRTPGGNRARCRTERLQNNLDGAFDKRRFKAEDDHSLGFSLCGGASHGRRRSSRDLPVYR